MAVKAGTVLLCDKNKRSSPLASSSRRTKRVVKYAAAVEAAASSEGFDIAQLMSELYKGAYILDWNGEIHTYDGIQSLNDTINTRSQVSLHVEISLLR